MANKPTVPRSDTHKLNAVERFYDNFQSNREAKLVRTKNLSNDESAKDKAKLMVKRRVRARSANKERSKNFHQKRKQLQMGKQGRFKLLRKKKNQDFPLTDKNTKEPVDMKVNQNKFFSQRKKQSKKLVMRKRTNMKLHKIADNISVAESRNKPRKVIKPRGVNLTNINSNHTLLNPTDTIIKKQSTKNEISKVKYPLTNKNTKHLHHVRLPRPVRIQPLGKPFTVQELLEQMKNNHTHKPSTHKFKPENNLSHSKESHKERSQISNKPRALTFMRSRKNTKWNSTPSNFEALTLSIKDNHREETPRAQLNPLSKKLLRHKVRKEGIKISNIHSMIRNKIGNQNGSTKKHLLKEGIKRAEQINEMDNRYIEPRKTPSLDSQTKDVIEKAEINTTEKEKDGFNDHVMAKETSEEAKMTSPDYGNIDIKRNKEIIKEEKDTENLIKLMKHKDVEEKNIESVKQNPTKSVGSHVKSRKKETDEKRVKASKILIYNEHVSNFSQPEEKTLKNELSVRTDQEPVTIPSSIQMLQIHIEATGSPLDVLESLKPNSSLIGIQKSANVQLSNNEREESDEVENNQLPRETVAIVPSRPSNSPIEVVDIGDNINNCSNQNHKFNKNEHIENILLDDKITDENRNNKIHDLLETEDITMSPPTAKTVVEKSIESYVNVSKTPTDSKTILNKYRNSNNKLVNETNLSQEYDKIGHDLELINEDEKIIKAKRPMNKEKEESELRESNEVISKQIPRQPKSLSVNVPFSITYPLSRSILYPNQIIPRVATSCFRFDCFAHPDHECCTSV